MTDLNATAATLGRNATEKARAFVNTNPLAQKAKDAIYTAVGFGVLGTQKATAAAKSANVTVVAPDAVHDGVRRTVTTVKRQASAFEEQFAKIVKSIDDSVAPLEQKLPTVVRDVTNNLRTLSAKLVIRRDDTADETAQ